MLSPESILFVAIPHPMSLRDDSRRCGNWPK
jgi:hypothetical protein